jgi:hypothetical protein
MIEIAMTSNQSYQNPKLSNNYVVLIFYYSSKYPRAKMHIIIVPFKYT